MNEADYDDQAERFLARFYRQSPRTTLEASFSEWSASKDFTSPDRKAIAARLRHVLVKGQL